jgi:hypothetical protein
VSNGPALTMPTSRTLRRRRKGGRRALILVLSLLVLLGLLVAADRVAVAYADRQVAAQLQRHGFPSRPQVTIEGFPFLTQLAARDIHDVRISAQRVHEGPLMLDIAANATGIRLGSDYRSGVISHVTGTGLIPFSDISSMAAGAGIAGLRLTPDGTHRVKLTLNLQVTTISAAAAIRQSGPDSFRIHLISTGGGPAAYLSALHGFTVHVPSLPLGLTIHGVSVTSQGVVVHVAGSDIPFGH